MSSKKRFKDEVWERIEELYFADPDPHSIERVTGIPARLIREVVEEQLLKNLKGAEEVWNIATKELISRRHKIDIIFGCMSDDAKSVDIKKAKKFLSYFKAQDNQLRGVLIKAMKTNPGASVSEWIESTENIKIDKEKMRSHGALQADIRNALPDSEERYKFLSELIEEIDNK